MDSEKNHSEKSTQGNEESASKKRDRCTNQVPTALLSDSGTSQTAPQPMVNDASKGLPGKFSQNTPSSSPPNKKMSSMEDMAVAFDAAQRLTLAHEIALDGQFKLPEKNSTSDQRSISPLEKLEKRVKEIAARAFWDVLREDLESDPVVYDHAFILLAEIKEMLLSLLPNRVTVLHKRINEALDVGFLKQQAEHDALNIRVLSGFLVDTMAAMCAPVRDDDVKALRSIEDIVDLFKGVYKVLEDMKRDFANHYIASMRPVIQQQHVEYEREKFAELLSKLNNGLEITERWLEDSYNELKSELEAIAKKQAEPSNSTSAKAPATPSALLVLKRAYIKLLDWEKERLHPETVMADEVRFRSIQDEFKKLLLVASLFLTTFSALGSNLSSHQSFVNSLKDDLLVLLAPEQLKDLSTTLSAIVEHIWSKTSDYLNSPVDLSDEKKDTLKNQIESLSNLDNHPVYQILGKRAREYMFSVAEYFARHNASTSPSLSLPSPPGLQIVFTELTALATSYSKLVNLNQTVYGPFYAPVLRKIMNIPATPTTSPVSSPRDQAGSSLKHRDELNKAKKKLELDSTSQEQENSQT